MGLFSGGFFGGGTDESSSSTTTTTNTQTTNTTRDIGLTGKDAAVLADTLVQGAVALNAGVFDFAKSLIETNEETTRMQKEYEGKFVQYQDQNVQKVLTAGFAAANPETSMVKDIFMYGALALGVFFIMGGAR